MSKTSQFYRYSSATQGLALWATWAFYINYNVSLSAAISAAIVQGLFSFFATLAVISLLTKLYNYFDKPILKLVLPPLLMILMLCVVNISAHFLANTPELFKTVAPSLFIATLFCVFTTYKLNK